MNSASRLGRSGKKQRKKAEEETLSTVSVLSPYHSRVNLWLPRRRRRKFAHEFVSLNESSLWLPARILGTSIQFYHSINSPPKLDFISQSSISLSEGEASDLKRESYWNF
jgi:hypothetical protein